MGKFEKKILNDIYYHITGCQTISGPDLDKPCKFPFIYRLKRYINCTSVDNDDKGWCSTEVDKDNQFIKAKWGNCSDSCPFQEGEIIQRLLNPILQGWPYVLGRTETHVLKVA